jgi:hypothetical protein
MGKHVSGCLEAAQSSAACTVVDVQDTAPSQIARRDILLTVSARDAWRALTVL